MAYNHGVQPDKTAAFLEHLDSMRGTLQGPTLEERGKILESVCRDAMPILRGRPDFEQIVRYQDPRSEEPTALWLGLVKKYRRDGHH